MQKNVLYLYTIVLIADMLKWIDRFHQTGLGYHVTLFSIGEWKLLHFFAMHYCYFTTCVKREIILDRIALTLSKSSLNTEIESSFEKIIPAGF